MISDPVNIKPTFVKTEVLNWIKLIHIINCHICTKKLRLSSLHKEDTLLPVLLLTLILLHDNNYIHFYTCSGP